jgi:hypothetical protein
LNHRLKKLFCSLKFCFLDHSFDMATEKKSLSARSTKYGGWGALLKPFSFKYRFTFLRCAALAFSACTTNFIDFLRHDEADLWKNIINITLPRPLLPLGQNIDQVEPRWISHHGQHCFRIADRLAFNCWGASWPGSQICSWWSEK